MVCAVYGSPIQETPEVAAARASHMAALATARALNALPPVSSPILLQQPVQDTPEVWAAKAEHYRVEMPFSIIFETMNLSNCYSFHQAYTTAAAANGVIASLPALQPYYVQAIPDTPEVWAAKQEFFRAYNEAALRG